MACLIGIRPDDISIRPGAQIGDYADEGYRKRALRILATFKKAKPDKGKKWIAQEDHDRVLLRWIGRASFVDTGAWVALFVEAEAQHDAARAWISSNRDQLITSDYIVDEALTLISVRFRRQTAVRAGDVLFGQDLARLIHLSEEDKERAWGIFRTRSHLIGIFRRGAGFGGCRTEGLVR